MLIGWPRSRYCAHAATSTAAVCSRLSAQTPAVTQAAAAAIAAIDRNLQLWSILQSVYYGLSLGSVLLLAAAGQQYDE